MRLESSKFHRLLLTTLITFIALFVTAFLILRGAVFLEAKLVSEIGEMVEPHYAFMKALGVGDYSKLPPMLTPQFRHRMNDFIAEWKEATRCRGSIRSFGKLEGGVNLEVYQGMRCLVFRGKQRVDFEDGSLIVHFISVRKGGKWLIDRVAVETI
ncbi:hypothetical protein GBSOP10_105812 [Armatimonadetes bacterium GBS]|jgi:hypothetical protein|nr:hypothetical protein HRbin14_00858 [bacterium HR14]CUU09154.1 hypothetical protein GBSOP10_105812 [Armatimonadetes bacterium GBS]CUU38779.1 hypothetical protein GXSOP10_14429 [Armatimonadetes bacterium GXS]